MVFSKNNIMTQSLILYGELYSKKNSKRVFKNHGKTIVLPSKAYEKAKSGFLWQLKDAKNKEIWDNMLLSTATKEVSELATISKLARSLTNIKKVHNILRAVEFTERGVWPIKLRIKIYRKTKREFDYNNIIQGLQDMLVEAGYLPDDSAKYLIPYFEPFEVDPKNPRVLLQNNLDK